MKTLLNFTPRLVAIVLFVFSGVSLMANSTVATTTAPGQSTVQVAIEFVILLFFILFPLFTKKSADRKTAK